MLQARLTGNGKNVKLERKEALVNNDQADEV